MAIFLLTGTNSVRMVPITDGVTHMTTNYDYTFTVQVNGKWIEKTVGGRSIEGRDMAAWDFARRQYRDPSPLVGKLVRTTDPRVTIQD